MEKDFFIKPEKELKEMEHALERNLGLRNDLHSTSALLLLYKMYELEKRLKIVESQTKTHWVE